MTKIQGINFFLPKPKRLGLLSFCAAISCLAIAGCYPEIDGVGPVVQLDNKESKWTSNSGLSPSSISFTTYSIGKNEFIFDKKTRRAIYNRDYFFNKDQIIKTTKFKIEHQRTSDKMIKQLKLEGLDCKESCARNFCTWMASIISGKDVRMSPKVCATISLQPDACFPEIGENCFRVSDFTKED